MVHLKRTMPSLLDRIHWRFEHWLKARRLAVLRASLADFGAGSSLELPAVIHGGDHVRIGARVSLNAFLHVWGQGGLSIGDDTLIASHVSITTLGHDPRAALFRTSLTSAPITIGRNVWIGTHATILPGVTIGDGAIVGAGAVVTRDVAAGTTVTGVPARRSDDEAGPDSKSTKDTPGSSSP